MELDELLDHSDGLVRTDDVRAAAVPRSQVRAALASERVVRPCRGWLARADAPLYAVVSVVQHGKLTGPSLLASLGAWDGCDARLHVLRSPRSHGAAIPLVPLSRFATTPIGRRGLSLHWANESFPDSRSPRWRTSVSDALLICSKCMPREQFIACVDSVLHLGLLPRSELRALRRALSAPRRAWLAEVDPRAESGLESLARVRLLPIVDRLELQVEIPGIGRRGGDGRVDILIDGWLVVELDGDAFHDPVVDRERTNRLIRMGYRVLRFGSKQVLEEWEDVVATVMAMLTGR